MPNEQGRETTSILAFVDMEENYTMEQLEDMSSKDYVKFLEDKGANMLIPYKPQERPPNIQKILETDTVLVQVEKELKELDEKNKKTDNTHHILKNPQ